MKSSRLGYHQQKAFVLALHKCYRDPKFCSGTMDHSRVIT